MDDEDGTRQEGAAGPPSESFVNRQLASVQLEDPGRDDVDSREKVSDSARQQLRSDLATDVTERGEEEDQSAALAAGGRAWSRCEALTAGLAAELTEQLRLILEPTVASRLAGDYRSASGGSMGAGKRINMKKVIAFIASHFRRDKFWLRRTQPDTRKYQVVVAVDESKSMADNGCGGVALEAVTLLTRALTRLEVGEIGVVGFGGTSGVNTIHELGQPFTDANGPAMLAALRFNADNSLADAPMVSLLESLAALLGEARQRHSFGSGTDNATLKQLVIIVADGRFHERAALQRAVRQASTQDGVLLAFIVLDNPEASLTDMRTVSFVDGKPSFGQYLDSFPFPYYVVLKDIASLPATLADLLRQFFQLNAQM